MKVINLVSWAGTHFCFEPGDEIDLPDDVARVREAAGLVSFPQVPIPSVQRAAPKGAAARKR
jgi:hypothetical protein